MITRVRRTLLFYAGPASSSSITLAQRERGMFDEQGGLILWDFYICAPGSLALLIHPHTLNFCSVFPTPLPETLRRGQNGRRRRVSALTINSNEWGRVGRCSCSLVGSWFRGVVCCIKSLHAPPRQKPAMHAPNKPAWMRRCASPRCADRACMRRCMQP